jgi:hypothetical protein
MGNDVKITLIATGFDSVRRPVEMRGTHTQRDPATYVPTSYGQQQPAQSQPQTPAEPTTPSGQSQPQVRVPEQPQARPMSQRPVQPQSGDELDIPPFLYPKFKNR